MNKLIIVMISIIVIISAIITAYGIIAPNRDQEVEQSQIAEEEILDDCTDEYEMIQQETMATNSEREKTSPNCSLTIKTYFEKCKHTTTQYSDLPDSLVNLTKDEIQDKYLDYKIETFSSNEIVLYQEKDGECGEHFLVKDNGGIVSVYKILEDGALEKIEETAISTEYLPESDKINMVNGIKVNGEQNLNQLLEDFE